MIARANFIFSTRLEYVVEVNVVQNEIYIDMKSSTSSRINKSIKRFMISGAGVAVFALRKNTSRNLLVLGVLRGQDVTFVPGSMKVKSRNGKFYREAAQFRVRLQKQTIFNLHIENKEEFYVKVNLGFGVGVMCPKMGSGKMPYVRGLISLLGATGSQLSKDGKYNVKYSGCFVKIQ